MEFQELIRRRYSVREYLPEPVSEEALARILEAGRLAPTAANRQPFRIVVLDTAGRLEALGRVYRHLLDRQLRRGRRPPRERRRLDSLVRRIR